LSLGEAVRNALFGARKNGGVVKTLIDEFKYPRHGPGQLWENVTKTITASGWDVRMNTRVVGLSRSESSDGSNHIDSVTVVDRSGQKTTIDASHVFSSMPLKNLLNGIAPPAPKDVLEAANGLKYRDFLTIVLVIDKAEMFPDNWIYVHEPAVQMGRIQNFKNWSPYMVPDQSKTCLGLEYFVNEAMPCGARPMTSSSSSAMKSSRRIGLAYGPLVKGYVVRMPKAYPVYDTGYQQRLDVIRGWLHTFDNLYCVGRNGQHRYNNQDHSMATALIAASNVTEHDDRDCWAVNEDAEYHEIAKTERQAPLTPTAAASV
jgi:protoporphyrinogen oxidase